jgi:hypothetical protein
MEVETAVLVLAVLTTSGCAYSNAGDAEQLSGRADRTDNSTYRVTYNFSLEGTSIYGSGGGEAVLYGFEGDTRFDRNFTYLQGVSQESIYSLNDSHAVKCRTSHLTNRNTSTRECNVTEATVSRYIDGSRYSNESYSVNYVEERSYAGRKCDFFRIGLPPSEFSGSQIDSGAIVDLCLDREKGYVAYNSMELGKPLSITGGNITTLYTLKALSYSSDVDESQVRPPANVTSG